MSKAGIQLTLPPRSSSFRRLTAGIYEPEATWQLRNLVKPGMTVVDAGANLGYYSTELSRLVAATGHVYAFEPEPEAYRYLLTNLKNNFCQNVTPVNVGLGERPDSARFVRNGSEGGFITRSERPDDLRIEVTSLDAFFGRLGWPPVSVIKLDIEGSERAALLGMRRLSEKNPELSILLEFNWSAMRRNGVQPADLTDSIRGIGFRQAFLIEQDMRMLSLEHPLPTSRIVYNLLITR
jgi:FkbM family methyltransferase